MKSLYHYLLEARKNFNLRIQVNGILDEEQLGVLKKYLENYQLVEISEPKRISMVKQLSEYSTFLPHLHHIDIVTSLPVNAFLLGNQLSKLFNMSLDNIKVWADGEPVALIQQQELAKQEIDTQASSKGLQSASLLSDNPNYEKFEQITDPAPYGNQYNNRLLQHLKQIADERNKKTKKGIKLFGWLDNFEKPDVPDYGDFNDGIDSVKPVYKSKRKEVIPDERVSRYGNFDDQIRTTVSKKFTNKNGKPVVVTAKLDNIRKES